MMQEVTVGSVSWINSTPLPDVTGLLVLRAEHDWVAKTYMGLAATANPPPPDPLTNFISFQGRKQFRALMFCRIRFEIDAKNNKLREFAVMEAAHDGGWTPPFDRSKFKSTYLKFWDKNLTDSNFHQGEASPVSVIRTEGRHPCSAISLVSSNEISLVNGLVKFRAGSHTDMVGVVDVKSPFHVPWVWCEFLLTYAKGNLKLYGLGSVFPSHAWYLNGKQVLMAPQVADTSLAKDTHPSTLRIYPMLSKGAAASGPQTSLAGESSLSSAVISHSNTAGAGSLLVYP